MGTLRAKAYRSKAVALETARRRLEEVSLSPDEARGHGIIVNRDGCRRSGLDLLGGYGMGIEDLVRIWPDLAKIPPGVVAQLESEAHYRGYLVRQDADIRAFRKDESLRIPLDFDFDGVVGLSNEQHEKLTAARPVTVGAAARLPGVTPAAVNLLLVHMRRSGSADARLPRTA